jgi:pimeloyl-ACP methyl ester carboxylesterase
VQEYAPDDLDDVPGIGVACLVWIGTARQARGNQAASGWAVPQLAFQPVSNQNIGRGMQRDVPDVSFDTWVRDLETVVDAAGLDRFSLMGISRGGAIAIAYAVKHPERVSKLMLYGAFAVGLYHYGNPEEIEARRALISLTRLDWGLHHPAFCRMFTNRFVPNSTPVQETWFDDLQRLSTSAEKAARLLEISSAMEYAALCDW